MMARHVTRVLGLLIPLFLEGIAGCAMSGDGRREPAHLSSSDTTHDQATIAASYREQAQTFRRNARDLADRLASYERIFGSDTDWVIGTKLLMQFYEDAAIERERKAERHDALARRSRLSGYEQSSSR